MVEIKVLYVAEGVGQPTNGAMMSGSELLASYPNDKVSVSVLTDTKVKKYYKKLFPHVKHFFSIPKSKIHLPIFGNMIYSFFVERRIQDLLRIYHFNIVHVNARVSFMPIPTASKTPTVFYLMNNPWCFYVNRFGPLQNTILESLFSFFWFFKTIRLIKKTSSYYFLESRQIADQLINLGVPSDHILLNSIGIIFQRTASNINNSDMKEQKLLRSLSILGKDHFLLLFVGRLCYAKNIHLLTKALQILNAHQRKIKLVLIGDAKDFLSRYYFRKLFKSFERTFKENILWIGEIKNRKLLKEIYHLVDIVIIPSLTEAGPRVFVEAISLEKHVLSTPVGLPHQFLDKKYLISPDNPNHLASRLLKILKEGTTQLNYRVPKIKTKFSSWNEIALRLADFYQAILDQS
ncbi:MAG: glycosyltransferase family 4 protein [Candidatus Hodarchaeota archaeon]